ncbi:uncharacterized protein ColSpa_11863 [Colletotrichum spaethianum]|uniref:Rhodopsin domain-containing protein n=1 Tax=Colletotrichum spaethianum TaxID=700344 RepID=A0AA37PGA1_9PEZI|nr:uncharacterized protein ColSpa_11863 [Colletotrichum spaethianum]GKT51682.1 hypothetical protein ColSpa_11863 [Colletotrichum spaethianum]
MCRLADGSSAFNIGTDIIFATLPTLVVWKLRMERKARFAVVMGIVKSKYQLALEKDEDKTFNQNIQVLGFLQLQLGIIAACATALRPLVKKILRLSSRDDRPILLHDQAPYPRRTGCGVGGDSASQKSILQDGITKTTEVTIKGQEGQMDGADRAESSIFPGQ